MKKFFSSKMVWLIAILAIVVITWLFISSSNNNVLTDIEVGTVERGEVVEVVSETGAVMAAQAVSLAFERGGRVQEINIEVGSEVEEGDVLIKLNSAQQSADLSGAYARLEAEQIRLEELLAGADTNSLAVTESSVNSSKIALENAKRNLADVIVQQDQLLANAEKTLRTNSLQAYLVSEERENSSDSFEAPNITGVYDSDEEGVYRIEVYSSGGASGASYRVTGLENSVEAVSVVGPTPIGSRGLYIQFPSDFANRTVWEVSIPNRRSSSYLTNQNAYKTAVESRKVAIANAENAVATAESGLTQTNSQLIQVSGSARSEKISAQRALVKQMQASAYSSQVAFDNTTIKAPFSGIVTGVTTEVGQIVSATVPIVSMISSQGYELTVSISEVDISEISKGDKAVVSFDAYDDVEFRAHVTQIAPNATILDGVRVFTVTLVFDEENGMIRDGLSADIDLTSAVRSDVIVVPTRSIYEDEEGKFVRKLVGEKTEIVRIKTGLRGSDGKTEIVEGLSGGEDIITFASEEAIAKLER